MKTQIIEQARSAAQVEAQKVMDNAKLQIRQQQKEAQQQFRNQVSEFALSTVFRIIGQANFQSTRKRTPKATNIQNIRPKSGVNSSIYLEWGDIVLNEECENADDNGEKSHTFHECPLDALHSARTRARARA